MKLVYRILSELFLLVSPIIILYRILKKKENKSRFLERYAFNSEFRKKGKLIWFHCSSVGELLSIIPLIEKFEKNKKISQILITTNTLSSSKIFNGFNLKKTVHQFFPIDNKLILDKFLSYWKPTICFLCESEIWPNLIIKINQRKIKLILINARITHKSFSRWINIKNFSNYLFKKFDICFVQNNETQKRLSQLGAKKIHNLGNLKFTTSEKVRADILDKKTLTYFKNRKILITAASTHYNEEDFIIKSHYYFKKQKKYNNFISIIVPRHVERVNQIKNQISKFSLKYYSRSSGKKIPNNIDFYIVDTYGELNKFYKISNLVFVGGSLINRGGQNPLEPAKLGCRIMHGPYVANFMEIYSKLSSMGISRMFKNYNLGIKMIENSIKKKEFALENKKLIKYGKKILNLTYLKITKFI